MPESFKQKDTPLQKEDQRALMSIAFGVLSVALNCAGYGIVFSLLGVVFGILGIKSKEYKKHAIAGIVLSILSLGLLVVIPAMEAINSGA
jgi:hypothetical protein